MNYIQIKDTLLSGTFDVLVGLVEDEHLEAKSGRYDLSNDNGKLELAKDVSSFANKSGGLIVIGAQTSEDPAFYGRRIESISTFTFDLINPTDYHNVIKEWLYPRPENIEILWTPSKADSSKGIVTIFISQQPENLRPFLLRKDIDPSTNRRRKEILFGYVERTSHSSDPAGIETIHTMLRLGRENRRVGDLEGRVTTLEATLTVLPQLAERKKNLESLTLLRVQTAIEAVHLQSSPHYCLSTSPIEPTEVDSLLSSATESISRLLENPPSLRYAGWGVETEDRARLINGEFRRVKVDQYKLLDLYRDGTLVFVCTADESLLGWGHTFGTGRINPLALIETTYMYFHFYAEVIKRFNADVKNLEINIRLDNLIQDDTKFSLAPHGVDAISQRIPHYIHSAPEKRFSHRLQVELDSFDPGSVALQVIREIYAWFSIEEDKIPYLTSDRRAVDVEKLKNPKSENR